MREKIERALQHWLDAALARIDGRLLRAVFEVDRQLHDHLRSTV